MALGEVSRVVGLVGFEAFPANGCGGTGEITECECSGNSETVKRWL